MIKRFLKWLRVENSTPLSVLGKTPPPQPKVLVKFWDKDFNLLGAFEEVPTAITLDHPFTGERFSWKVQFTR
jgi:hypothetical protein